MKRILYISYDGMTDPLGQSQVVPYLIGLSKEGYTITILSAEKEDFFSQQKEHIHSLLLRNGIEWIFIKYKKKPPVVSTILDVYRLKSRAIKLHGKYRFDIVHCRSYIPSLVGHYLKKRFGLKFVFDMRGFWADERIDGGLWKISNPIYKLIYRYFKSKETKFLLSADYIVSLTEEAKKEMLSWDKLKIGKLSIEVIPCCTDESIISRERIDVPKRELFKRKFNISEEDFILSYLGGIGTWYMLDEMLDFFKVMQNKIPHSKFLFITFENPIIILKRAENKNIDTDKIIVTSANRSDLPSIVSLSRISIFFIKPLFSKKASSPTKQGEIMLMGIPVICNEGIGDTDFIVEKYKSGLLISEFTKKEYERTIARFEELMSLDSQSIISGARDYFSLAKGVAKYKKIYNTVLDDTYKSSLNKEWGHNGRW